MAFKCCRLCVPPKRNPGCHDHCSDYLEERAAHDAKKADDDKKRQIKQGLYEERSKVVRKAIKKWRFR